MKVVCMQENLKKGLNATSRVSSGSTTLPVLNNILLKTDQGTLRLSATNLEMGVNTWVRGKVEEDGGLSVPAKTFVDLINNLPNDKITLTLDDNNHLLIETDNYRTKIKGLGADEFPLIPEVDQDNMVEIKAKDLRTAINQTTFAAAYSETQPEISGILFAFEGKVLKLVATDRYRLAEKAVALQGFVEKSIIVPNRAVQELAKILSVSDIETVKVFFTQNQVMFKTDDSELISRLIDGQYPEYKAIIPPAFDTHIEVVTADLGSAMRTAGIFTQTGNNVTLEYSSPKHLLVSSSSGDLGESKVEVPCAVDGKDGRIIFNHRFILDCLATIGTDKVTFQVIDENAPAVIVSSELPGYVYLVMPIKI